MAKSTLTEKTVLLPSITKTVNLELTINEATTLRAVLCRASSSDSSANQDLWNIWDSLTRIPEIYGSKNTFSIRGVSN